MFGDFWRTTKLTKNTKKKALLVVFVVFVVDLAADFFMRPEGLRDGEGARSPRASNVEGHLAVAAALPRHSVPRRKRGAGALSSAEVRAAAATP
jgi:hypothetical protein